jgi:undecaprenyl-diphosphatase
MDLLEALVLGVIQGITEWLPVSSSGHLVIGQEFLGLPAEENLLFDLAVHLGTLASVCVYFRKELGRIVMALVSRREGMTGEQLALRRLGLLILIATVPVALVGIALTDVIDAAFSLSLVGLALIVNSAVLFLAERLRSSSTRKDIGTFDAAVVGLFQAAAIIPGISRSGSSISGGIFRGLERETAATFAFLISVPALLGAFLYGSVTLERFDADAATMTIGAVSAFLTGIVSIEYLLRAVRARKLWAFSAYCAVLGAIVIAASL